MKIKIIAVTYCLGTVCWTGCASSSKPVVPPSAPASAQSPAGTNVLSDEKARTSYAIGMTFGHNFKTQGIEVDTDMLVRGLKDMQSGGPTLLTEQEMRETLTAYQKVIAAKQQKMREEAAAKNKAAGEAFLAANKAKPGVVTLPDGLQYKILTEGTGAIPTPEDVVTVNYRGTLVDGTEFDSSISRGQPAQFPVGNVIHGWTEALTQMKVGSKWQIFVPSELAYGTAGRPPRIQPDSVLIFEVELVSTEHPNPTPSAGAVSTTPPLTSDIIKVPSLEEMKKGAKIEVIKPEDAAKLQQSQPQPAK